MATLTSRERIMRIFRNEQYDRPSLKLWALTPNEKMLHPAYIPVYEKGMQLSDIYAWSMLSEFNTLVGKCTSCSTTGQFVNMLVGSNANGQFECVKLPPYSSEFGAEKSVLHTEDGDLTSTFSYSTIGQPGYITEHFVKEPEDLKKVLSLEYSAIPFNPKQYIEDDRMIGDKGIPIYYLHHPFWTLADLCGSTLIAIMSTEEEGRSLITEALSMFAFRLRKQVERVFATGLKPVFGWGGPEFCVPPLMSYRDFDDFVVDIDKPLCDCIHENGGYVWVHSHGKMRKLIERFIYMGVDVLNPIEPPPMGDITMEEAAKTFKNRIGLEGNVEINEIVMAEPEVLRTRIKEAFDGGINSGRFILCQSAGYMEEALPTQRFIENMLLYLDYGYELVTSYAK